MYILFTKTEMDGIGRAHTIGCFPASPNRGHLSRDRRTLAGHMTCLFVPIGWRLCNLHINQATSGPCSVAKATANPDWHCQYLQY